MGNPDILRNLPEGIASEQAVKPVTHTVYYIRDSEAYVGNGMGQPPSERVMKPLKPQILKVEEMPDDYYENQFRKQE